MPKAHPTSKLPKDTCNSLSSERDIVKEYTNVPIIDEQPPCIILSKKIIEIKII